MGDKRKKEIRGKYMRPIFISRYGKKTVFQEYVPISPKSLTLKEEVDTHSEVRQKDTSKEK